MALEFDMLQTLLASIDEWEGRNHEDAACIASKLDPE